MLFAASKDELWRAREALEHRLAGIRLRLHEHKTQLQPSQVGLRFLGFRLFHHGRRLTRDGIRRFILRRREFQQAFREGRLDLSQVRQSLNAWNAHVATANVAGLRRDLMRHFRFRRGKSTST